MIAHTSRIDQKSPAVYRLGMADGQPEGILELTLMGHPTLQVECSTHFGVLQKKAGRRSPPGLELVTV
jgi:hypothetical protein